jgi:hypothetical protein
MREFSEIKQPRFQKVLKVLNIRANNALGALKKQKKFMTADVER